MSEKILRTIERFIPQSVYRFFQPFYHFLLAFTGAYLYRFPGKEITVIFVTGTKGKTSTTEILNNMLEASGATTAVLGTLRFKVREKNERNLRKMTIPGRFFVQKFLREAVEAGCKYAIIEMTSEGAKQYRHRFIDSDALIFTNLSPEHIESHGSYEAYLDAKLSIARSLAKSRKPHRFMIANADDKEGKHFLAIKGVESVPFRKTDIDPIISDSEHTSITWRGKQVISPLPGLFNAYNLIAAATCASVLGISDTSIITGITQTKKIEGRAERIDEGQVFPVVVDYAHTPDSLVALYTAYKGYNTVCILGNTGGGRDKWKRPQMGKIAETYCSEVILTNEDPYDEDPMEILKEMQSGMEHSTPTIILDRRIAITEGIRRAKNTDHAALLITGKGTDPFIMGPNGTKTQWDDRDVTREELKKSLS